MTETRTVRLAEGPVIAEVTVPPSKSIANRALVCAALAGGESEIAGLAPGDDTNAMVDCLRRLGVPVELSDRQSDDPSDQLSHQRSDERPGEPSDEQSGHASDARPGSGAASSARITGTGGALPRGPITLDTRLAGTTSRFITALAALGPGPYVVDGAEPLRSRPMGPLHDSLHALGARLEPGEQWGHLPVTISGPVGGADAIVMPGDVSSQYVTALMLIAPLIRDGLSLGLSTDLVSRPYVEITKAVMTSFGATDIHIAHRHVTVAESGYHPTRYEVEPDASSASYPLAAAAIVGGAVSVKGLGHSSLQGDAAFSRVLEQMGCIVTTGPTDTVVMRRRDTPLHGIDIDMAHISDLVPTLAVVATQATTPTRIRGVGFIRDKESDRLGDLAAELRKLGADITVETDGLTIAPTDVLEGHLLDTHHDHRLAMSFGLLGLVVSGLEVADPGVVSKSWPSFWDVLDEIPARRA